MLTQETKRHIDAARQVLVGVVPNPSSQIDQITNALIYKFMDDMDQSAIKAGGDPSFFVGSLERYAWTRLMDSRLGNQERMNLYSEALIKFSESKQLPPLFREIFKSAFLSYRSPEVLGLFLKEIDYFDYSHSEELGNAYEYLLSIMGSQGDAGQFRTPRHIIDFIVAAVNPTKDDKVLDPACGTAGFLVSAYKHILEQHNACHSRESGNPEKPLTPDQRKALMNNFEGYDIDPGMVRISQVNLYLHNFRNPKIYNYNTLSQDERWADKFDVILANPPFMSPKGGVSTHNKFSVQSSRSEVLFVDYIMNHLCPKGRAGIIVPEGIIFQSGTAHKQLRKNLIQDGLYAVVSLPSGVFQPYSGVKTSILLFNNELAKRNTEILFVKVENDGFDLGATKRPINKNDLPQALEIIRKWQSSSVIAPPTEQGAGQASPERAKQSLAIAVSKAKIAETGDYNFSGDRYRIATDYTNAKWPMVAIEGLCDLGRGRVISKKDMENKPGPFPVFSSQTTDNGIFGYLESYDFDGEYVTWTTDGANAGTVFYRSGKFNCTNVCGTLKAKATNINMHFLAQALNTVAYRYVIQAGNPKLMNNVMAKIKIPLPPLEIQEQVVAELDGYQNIISGARQVGENWKPKIEIDPKWERVELGDDSVIQVIDGDRGTNYPAKEEFRNDGYCLFLNTSNVRKGAFDFAECNFITKEKDKSLRKGKLVRHDVVLTTRGTLGNTAHYSEEIIFDNIRINSGMVILRVNNQRIQPAFLLLFLNSKGFDDQVTNFMSGSAQPQLPIRVLSEIEIPAPSIAIQKQIVEKIEAERALIESAKKLIGIYEQKTKDVIAKLWRE